MRVIDADDLEKSLEDSCDSEVASYYFTEFLSYVDEQPTIDNIIIFPQTIGDITFCNKEHLFWWVLRKQKQNYVKKYTYEMDLDG